MFRNRKTRAMTPRGLRWLFNFYPPFLFQRIRTVYVADDFHACRVEVRPSLRTRNIAGTTFGATIFAAADPFHVILLWQIFAHRGVRLDAWLRGGRVRYLRPARTTLTLEFAVDEADVVEAADHLERHGRWTRWYRTEARDRDGDVCAVIETEVYLGRRDRNRNPGPQTEARSGRTP